MVPLGYVGHIIERECKKDVVFAHSRRLSGIGVCKIKERKTMDTTTAKDIARELSEKEDVSSSESIRRVVKEIKEKTKEDKVEPILESFKKR